MQFYYQYLSTPKSSANNQLTNMIRNLISPTPIKLLLIFLLLANVLNAQNRNDPAARKELFNKIASLDSLLFTAFNTCDLETFQKLISKDLEFYDDRTGLND